MEGLDHVTGGQILYGVNQDYLFSDACFVNRDEGRRVYRSMALLKERKHVWSWRETFIWMKNSIIPN